MASRSRRWLKLVLLFVGSMLLLCVLLLFVPLVVGTLHLGRAEAGPRFEVGWIRQRLRKAGFVVSVPSPDTKTENLSQVVSGQCFSAVRADEAATYCVLQCANDSACRGSLLERGPPLGESYMQVHRQDTVLIQRSMQNGAPTASRDAIFAR